MTETPILLPRSQRGLGHLVRDWAAGTPTIRHLLGGGRQDWRPVDWSAYVDQVRDQRQTQRCVGAARARVLHCLAQRQAFGRPNPGAVPYPSEQGIYSLARQETSEPGAPLLDVGSSPSAADEALARDVGVPMERDWDPPDEQVNERVPVEVLARAIPYKLAQHYVFDSGGAQRVDDSCQALSQHGPFTCAIPVGDEYDRGDTGEAIMPAQNVLAFHCVALMGWRPKPGRDSTRQFLNCGSFGAGWSRGGWAWLDESVLQDPRAIDFSVPTLLLNWVRP